MLFNERRFAVEQPQHASNQFASDQESAVHAFASYCLSATMIFAPNEFKKGNATREPCDLVWVARDMLFLIAMQASTKPQLKQDNHNVTQLRGWLRTWCTSDIKLEGATPITQYSISHDELPLVLVSVADAEDGKAAILRLPGAPKNEAEEKVLLACSIPAVALMQLAHTGGGAADLACLIDQLAKAERPVSTFVFLQWIDDLRNSSYHRLLVKHRIPQELSTEFLDTYPHHVILSLRHSGGVYESGEGNKANYAVVSAFNDLNWFQTYEICWYMAYFAGSIIETPVGELGPGAMGRIIKSGNYTIYVGAYAAAAPGALETVMEGYAAALKMQKEGFPVLSLMMMISDLAAAEPFKSIIFGGEVTTGPSNARRVIERAASRIASRSMGEE